MRKKILYLLILMLLNNLLKAQINYAPNNPTSPEVAKISQYGNIPVNNFTGSITPTIPIYTIKDVGIEIPINLIYSSNGIKVAQQSTWVGLGWDLIPEGVIVQEVRGRNDDYGTMGIYDNSYQVLYDRLSVLPPLDHHKVSNQIGLNTIQTSSPWSITCQNDSPDYQIEPQDPMEPIVKLSLGYGQPDIYNFSFMGYSGDFYINPTNRKIVQLDKKEEIKWDTGAGQFKFTATTADGIVYYFGDLERIYYNGAMSQSQYDNFTIKLTKIRLTNGNEIFFDYQDARYYDIYYTQNNIFKSHLSPLAGDPLKYIYNKAVPNFSNSDTKILKRIRTNQVTVEFNLEDRADVYQTTMPLKRVASIDIISNNNSKKIKSVFFKYDYFPFSTIGLPNNEDLLTNVIPNIDAFGKRLKLNNVTEVFYNKNNAGEIDQKFEYSFDYNMSTTLPVKISFSKDIWGYYNGSQGSSITPNLDYFLSRGINGDEKMDDNYSVYSNNKFSNNLYNDAYLLNKITYPTKGFTRFKYESNTFSNQYIPTIDEENDLKKIINLNNNGSGIYTTSNSTYTIHLNSPKKIRFINKINRGIPNAPMQTKAYTYAQMLEAGASIKLFKIGNDQNDNVMTEIKKWDLTSVLSTAFETNLKVEWDEDIRLIEGDYKIQLNIDNSLYDPADLYHIAGVTSQLKYYSDPVTNLSTQLGVRIANVKNFDSNGNLLGHVKYYYEGGVNNNRYNIFSQNNDMYEFTQNSGIPLTISYNNINGADVNSYVSYKLVKVSDIDINTEKIKGSTTFHYYNFGNISDSNFPVKKNPLNGLVFEEIVENELGVISHKLNEYQDISSNERYLSVQSFLKYINELPFPLRKNNGFCYPKYQYYITPLITTFVKKKSTISENYLQSSKIVGRSNYEYNSIGLLTRQEEIDENSVLSKEYKYSADLGNFYLNSKNMVGIPLIIESKKTLNGLTKTLSKTVNYYPTSQDEARERIVNNTFNKDIPLPYDVFSSDLKTPSNTSLEVTYEKYDVEGNLLQYTSKSGVPTAIIWGYNNTQPIAKVEGALYDQANSIASAIITASNTDASQPPNTDESALLTALDTFRKDGTMSGYQITTYTYDPLVGVRSVTPPNGIRENYIYDTAGRLKEVRDINGNILKENKYNYKN